MQVTIQPSRIDGNIQAPASKSSMQRACAAALLYKGSTTVHNPGHSNDDRAALGVIHDLGAKVSMNNDGSLAIESMGVHPIAERVNCGESGLGIRMFAPIIALSSSRIAVNGEGSLLMRPMDFFDTVFPLLGISVTSNHGKLPLVLNGPLQAKDIEIDGSLSSQFLTGLLFAYAAAGASDVSINVVGLKSKPYIDLTLQVMKHFGWQVTNKDYRSFYFPGDDSVMDRPAIDYTVEGDWSGGAFLLVAGAIAGDIQVSGLDVDSTQADRKIMDALELAGASVNISEERIRVAMPSSPMTGFSFDATDCPDLFPPLVALAANCTGTSTIAGVTRLSHKESDRGATLQEEFGKMGVLVTIRGDLMHIEGNGPTNAAIVDSHHDHRIAMACAVAGLTSSGETVIHHAEAVSKSYPDFFDDIHAVGAKFNVAALNNVTDLTTNQTQ